MDNISDPLQRAIHIGGDMSSLDLTDMLQWTNHCEFSDPRDRVYAILSTIRSSESTIRLKPDYSQTARKVFQDVILRNLTKTGRLNLLAWCEMRGVLGKGPTWVLDFSAPKDSTQLVNLNSCWMSKAQAEYAGGGTLFSEN